jgi:KUP system potassium uptake protein
VLIFESSSALAGAYTFAIAGTMLITTICIYWVAKETWKMNKFLLFPILGFFMVVDLAFLASTSTKIMTGAWLPLTIGITLAFMMWIWRKGRNHLGSEMTKIAFTVDALNEYRNNPAITIDNSVGIYLSSQEGSLPQALHEQIRLMRHMPEKIVIVTVTPIDYPYALHKPKYEQINDYLIQVTVENGFMENRNIPLALKSDNLAHLFDEESAVYFLVDRTLQRNREIGLNASEELVYIALHRNAAKASQFFNLPADRVMTFDVKMDM